MPLILDRQNWRNCTTNLTGTPSATVGTSVTAGGVAHTDGNTALLVSNVAHDVHMIGIGIQSTFTSASNGSALVDLRIDPSGGGGSPDLYVDLISDLVCGNVYDTGDICWYCFPLFVKSGASFGARVRNGVAGKACGVVVQLYGGPSRPDQWWCGQSVTSLGINAGTSSGTSITPGNTGAFSAWQNLGSTLPQAAGAIQFGIQGGGQTTMTQIGYHFQFAIGGQSPDVQRQIGPTYYVRGNTNEGLNRETQPGPILCNLPAGTQLQMRATASGTAQAYDAAAYVVH